MGDQIGQAVTGTMYYVGRDEFDRVRTLDIAKPARAALFATLCRINALYMIARAGSGHIGSSFSSLDIVSWLYLNELGQDDIYFSSKGHDCPALYAVLIALGRLEEDKLHALRRLGGLPGHPDVRIPGIEVNSGSLGMGISKAKGMIQARRIKKEKGRVFVLTGDGELQEGQFWESLVSAANDRMGELTVLVDHNKYQSDRRVSKTSDLGDLEAKFKSFSWHVSRVDGHDMGALQSLLADLDAIRDQPKLVIADTIKGKGVSFMEHTALANDEAFYPYHSGAPDAESYRLAVQELLDGANTALGEANAAMVTVESVEHRPPPPSSAPSQRLIDAYSAALLDQARRNPRIVALDADLILDTGLGPFAEEFPERFIECGIAEQDMVSQAGGLALQGLLPVVHSFACFLSTRPNEQIYTNATEGTKIIYVGSLAGLLPAGPGHSHQSVRDVSALGAIPGLVLAEPCCEDEVAMLVDYALNRTDESFYLRLTSIPYQCPFTLPADYSLGEGRGVVITPGSDASVIASGIVMVSECVKAADILKRDHGFSLEVINLPWLNRIDQAWLGEVLNGTRSLFTVENHSPIHGQGQAIAAAIAHTANHAFKHVLSLGVESIPVSGTAEEALKYHGLDAQSLAATIADTCSK